MFLGLFTKIFHRQANIPNILGIKTKSKEGRRIKMNIMGLGRRKTFKSITILLNCVFIINKAM